MATAKTITAVPKLNVEAIDSLGRLLGHIEGLASLGAQVGDEDDAGSFPVERLRELLWSVADFARDAMIATNKLEQQYREALTAAKAASEIAAAVAMH